MHTYRNLWEKLVSDENIYLALKLAKKSKRFKERAREDYEKYYTDEKTRKRVRNYVETNLNIKHDPNVIVEGAKRKVRIIIAPTYSELIARQAMVNILQPIIMKGMYQHSFACIPKRGTDKARKVVEKWIRKDPRGTKYCLLIDIHKFFDSIDHDVMFNRINKTIKDPKILERCKSNLDIIDKGLPLGFPDSHWLANWLLQDLDHKIKEKLKAKYYARYNDDMLIFDPNKKKLHYIATIVGAELAKMSLYFNPKWQIFRVIHETKGGEKGRVPDYVGFKFFRNRTILRRTTYYKACRKAKKIGKKITKGIKPTLYEYKQLLSLLGRFKQTNTYIAFQERIKPYVDIHKIRKRISRHDRRENRERNNYVGESTVFYYA